MTLRQRCTIEKADTGSTLLAAREKPMNVNKRGSPRSLKSVLALGNAHAVQPDEYEELPELTKDLLARAKVNKGWQALVSKSAQIDFAAFARRRPSNVGRQRAQVGKRAWRNGWARCSKKRRAANGRCKAARLPLRSGLVCAD